MFRLLPMLFILALAEQSFYDLLGVEKTAPIAVIKKEFKKLSRKYHPDKNIDNKEEAERMFMKVAHAYEVLSDSVTRKIYDNFGEGAINDPYGFTFPPDLDEEVMRDPDIRSYFQGGKPASEWFEETDVMELFGQNIQMLLNREQMWMVMFYTPDNSQCQTLKREWIRFANRMFGIAEVGAINCKKEPKLCNQYYINNHPTILYFPADGKKHSLYKGEKKFQAWSDFVSSKLSSVAELVTDSSYDSFVDHNIPKVVYFHGGSTTPPLIKAMSMYFEGTVLVGEVRLTELDLIDKFDITKVPALFALGDEPFKFKKAFYIDEIDVFIKNFLKVYKRSQGSVEELTLYKHTLGKCTEDDKGHCFLIFSDDLDKDRDTILNVEKTLMSYEIEVLWVNSSKFKGFAREFSGKMIVYKPKRRKYVVVECGDDMECIEQITLQAMEGKGHFKNLLKTPEFKETTGDL